MSNLEAKSDVLGVVVVDLYPLITRIILRGSSIGLAFDILPNDY